MKGTDMRKYLAGLSIAAVLFTAPAAAQTINNLGAGRGSVIGTDLFPSYQGANPAVRPTAAQIAAYVYGLASGDLTANGTGGHTLATVNGNVGSFGSTTNCVTLTVNAKGLITAASQAACAPPFSAVTGRSTLAQAPQGIANSIWINPTGSTADMQNLAVPACANDGAHALVYVNGSGLVCATITAGTGTVTNIATSCGVGGGAITTTGTIRGATSDSTISGTSYSIVDGDCGLIKRSTNASLTTITVGSPSGFTNPSNWFTTIKSDGAAGVSIAVSGVTIDGSASSITVATGKSLDLYSDGTNYHTLPGNGGGGGTPGGSNGQLQINNAGAFGGVTLGGDCTFASPNINCGIDRHPGYLSGRWYHFAGAPSLSPGGAPAASTIYCHFAPISGKSAITVNALGVGISGAGSSNAQIALYANSSGRPGALVGNTGNIANNVSSTAITGTLAANKNVGPGGSDGGADLWACFNQNDSTATYATATSFTTVPGSYIGSATATDILTGGANGMFNGIQCSGAGCNGGSSTFGSWPASLAGSTWNNITPGCCGNFVPQVIFKIN